VLAGERPRPQRVGGGGDEHLLLDHRVGLGLVGGEPHRTAPHALGAEGHRRGHLAAPTDATSTQHRDRCDGVDHLGDEHHGSDLAGVATGLGTLGDDDVDTGLHVALGVHRLAGQGTDEATLLLHPVDEELRGRAERVGDERGTMGQVMSSCGPAEAAENGTCTLSLKSSPAPPGSSSSGRSGTS
jgi:hypothetical protein